MNLDALARLAFAFTISVHYVFPLITIGGFFWLAWRTFGVDPWSKVKRTLGPLMLFVVLGISTGYVLKWHFEMIWTPYYDIIATMFDPVLGLEAPISLAGFVVFLFLLFVAYRRGSILLLRVAAIGLVLTTLVSATAITSVNAWMQYPSGVRLISNPLANSVERISLPGVIFSPTFWTRLQHVLLGALMIGISWFSSRFRLIEYRALFVLLMIWVGQFYVGHRHAGEVYAYQPEKFAAFEGHQSFYGPADLWLLPVKNHRYNIKLEGMASKMLVNDATASMPGLDAWDQSFLTDLLDAVFASYHTMVLSHIAILFALLLIWYYRDRRPKRAVMLMKLVVGLSLLANYAGWYTAEMGRQPWIIRGIMLTRSASVPASSQTAYMGMLLSLLALVVPLILWRIFGINQRVKRLFRA
jgi:cytochrome d ubiquinol oxidase subunit I